MDTCLSLYHSYYKSFYNSPSQLIRVISENWFKDNMYCPFCVSNGINSFQNNYPVADFYCGNCGEEFQLKSKKNCMGNKMLDGEYNKMVEAIYSQRAPNFFFLNYTLDFDFITNLMIVPKEFILPNTIQKRNPLSLNAKRAGWTGCNILLEAIPNEGKIFAVKNSQAFKKEEVRRNVLSIEFVRQAKDINSRGWLNDLLLIISKIKTDIFKLDAVYNYSSMLKKRHPQNNNIEAKIRQQLQILRDNNIIDFVERGVYKKL